MQHNIVHCEERKAKEKAKRATKLGDQGGKRVEQDFFFDLGFMGGSPEGNRSWIRDWIWAAFNKSPGILWRQESQREEGEGQCWNRKSRLEATSWMPSLLPLSSPVPNQLLNPDQWPWTNALQWSIEALTNQYHNLCILSKKELFKACWGIRIFFKWRYILVTLLARTQHNTTKPHNISSLIRIKPTMQEHNTTHHWITCNGVAV